MLSWVWCDMIWFFFDMGSLHFFKEKNDHRREESRKAPAHGEVYADVCNMDFQSRLAPGEALVTYDHLPRAVPLSVSDNLLSCLISFSSFSAVLSRPLLGSPITWSLSGPPLLRHLSRFQMKNWSHGPEGFWATLTRNFFSLCSWMTASLMASSTSCESDISWWKMLFSNKEREFSIRNLAKKARKFCSYRSFFLLPIIDIHWVGPVARWSSEFCTFTKFHLTVPIPLRVERLLSSSSPFYWHWGIESPRPCPSHTLGKWKGLESSSGCGTLSLCPHQPVPSWPEGLEWCPGYISCPGRLPVVPNNTYPLHKLSF